MPDKSTVLVTGGAGYIGSHTVLQLVARGERVVVLDDLSTGFRQAVRDVPLVVGNVGDRELVDPLLAEHRVDTIIHFAAHTIVPESVSESAQVLRQQHLRDALAARSRVAGRREALRVLLDRRRLRHSGRGPRVGRLADRAHQSLRHLETHVRVDAARPVRGDADAPRRAALLQRRRLRPAGPHRPVDARRHAAGQGRPCEAAVGKRPYLSVFGTDYPTPDGTGVRDYIHVEDLATAHLNALDYLRAGGKSLVANCGYGHGYSVREVLSSRGEDRRRSSSTCAKSRAAPAIRPAWSPGATGCARCSAGSRGSTTSTPSCAPRSSGKSVCNANPGRPGAS